MVRAPYYDYIQEINFPLYLTGVSIPCSCVVYFNLFILSALVGGAKNLSSTYCNNVSRLFR